MKRLSFVLATLLSLRLSISGTIIKTQNLSQTLNSGTTPLEETQSFTQLLEISESPQQEVPSISPTESTTYTTTSSGVNLVQKRIPVTEKRVELTKEYTKIHYGFERAYMDVPKTIVLHWTAGGTADSNYNYFYSDTLSNTDAWHAKYGYVNVSAHFIVDRDGTIYQLLPENFIARHCIGMNYHAIGVENVGGVDGKEDLTDAQVRANIWLVKRLQNKFPSISLVIGHYEYLRYENTLYFTELIDDYRTAKSDPGATFMRKVREGL